LQGKNLLMTDLEGIKALVDEIVLDFTREMKAR
jgi:hypothetical protein